MIARIHGVISNLLYLIASVLLLLLSGALIVLAVGQLVEEILKAGLIWRAVLQAIELTIVGVAVFDVSKFLVEEGVIRGDDGANYSAAARRSLTKFMTIIIVAVSLDALLNIFETNEEDRAAIVYPVMLLGAAILALVGLGVFHYLSRAATPADRAGK